jgi:hypothetical protein
VHLVPFNWGRNEFERLLGHKRNLILLPQFLSRVSNEFPSGNSLNSLLRIVHKYPLLEDDYSKSDELSSLYKRVITAAEKYLGPYSRVRVRFYTMRIPLTQIPDCRYVAQVTANMKRQKRSSHRRRPMSLNLFEMRLPSNRVALDQCLNTSFVYSCFSKNINSSYRHIIVERK